MRRLIFVLCLFQGCLLVSQQAKELVWRNVLHSKFKILEGQAWPEELDAPFDRLPKRAIGVVREAVWDLSRHSAGIKIRFRSNAEKIVVRYGVQLSHAMNHMPATGVSGVDLYGVDAEGKKLWCRGTRVFSDTITYQFNGLRPNDQFHDLGREYRLNFPLYNSVSWMEIGVSVNSYFEFLPIRKEKPIVVYGTSIAHGASASRPGMAWTNILSRNMDRPLINLAFSGNGRLEKELIVLLSEIEAKLYILDCLPNLWRAELYDDEELENRILNAVRQLKHHRPDIPILLTEHAGYTDGFINPQRKQAYTRVNDIQKAAFEKLKLEGLPGLHYLSYEELGLQIDDMVDGTHPNDLGMMRYAKAYENKIRQLLNERTGDLSTTLPVTQRREPGNYEWDERHNEILAMNSLSPPNTVLLANSIIHFWGGLPRSKLVREASSWEEFLTPMGVRNYAFGWDRIENVLWRVHHGELDGYKAKRIMVLIGTNNLHLNSDVEIVTGLENLMNAIRVRQPQAELVLMGILPRRNLEGRVAALNRRITKLSLQLKIKYADLGAAFLNENKTIKESLFSDGLHPNAAGYVHLREALLPLLKDK